MVLEYDIGDLRATAAAVAVTLFRPADDGAVLVVAASDEAAVEARLRPQLGDLLCVVPSRWTKAELDRVLGYLHERHEQWDLYQSGPHVAGDWQPCVSAGLVRVLPEIAAWAASLPAGILVLEPWLVRSELPERPSSLCSPGLGSHARTLPGGACASGNIGAGMTAPVLH